MSHIKNIHFSPFFVSQILCICGRKIVALREEGICDQFFFAIYVKTATILKYSS
jgi:hypothetical protein